MKDSCFPALISGLLCMAFLIVPLPRVSGAETMREEEAQ